MNKQNNIPELRFPEFDEEWNLSPIDRIANIFDGTHQTPKYVSNGVPFVSVENIYDIEKTDKFITKQAFEKDFKTKPKKGDILMTRITAGIIGATSIIRNDRPLGYYVSLAMIRIKTDHDVEFIDHSINTNQFKHELHKRIIHVAFPKKINLGDIGDCIISFPSLPEQQKIASFFTAIDQKISQLKQKKTLLEQYKKGVMQKIFSHGIRFKDDDGQEFPKWEKKNLNEVYSFKTTNSFSRDNLNYESGDVKNIHYGDIHTKYPTLLDITQHDVPYVNSDISIKKIKADSYCINNDLIFADASEDVPDVGKCIEFVNINGEKVLAGLHTILARPDIKKVACGFGGYLMASNGIRKQIMKISQGSKVTSISSTRLGEIEIELPCPEEQTKIANFLSAIDNKINHTHTQIKNAELWKKGLLQKMFV